MLTLGLNAAFHDSAACLVRAGYVLAAAEEERFTHIKHAKRPIPFSAYELPFHAVDYCVAEGGIELSDVDHIAYSLNPYLLTGSLSGHESVALPLEPSRWEREADASPWDALFVSFVINAPRHLGSGYPHHLQKRFVKAVEDSGYRWHFVDHHLAHAAMPSCLPRLRRQRS